MKQKIKDATIYDFIITFFAVCILFYTIYLDSVQSVRIDDIKNRVNTIEKKLKYHNSK